MQTTETQKERGSKDRFDWKKSTHGCDGCEKSASRERDQSTKETKAEREKNGGRNSKKSTRLDRNLKKMEREIEGGIEKGRQCRRRAQ